MPPPSVGAPLAAAIAIGVALAGAIVARLLSRWARWEPAGPIGLIAAAPLLPHVPLFASFSADDLLPLLGLGLLIWGRPMPRVPSDRVLRWILAAAALATLARVASALVNGGVADGNLNMLAQAIGRPLVLLAVVAYVAVAAPEHLRQRWVAASVAAVGTIEAAFGLLGFLVRLPGDAGIEPARHLTSLYGVCPGRISGTLGLSANHLGAVFVLSVPLTLGLAVTQTGWRRWAWAAAAAVQGAALILTFTRSSILLAAIISVAFLVYQRKFVILAAVAVMTAGIVASAFTVSCTAAPLGSRFSDGNDRLALWYAAGLIMVDHPLVGIGLDRMNEVVTAEPERYRDTPFGPATSSAHNTILLAGAETGVLGALGILGINIGLAVVAARTTWRSRRGARALPLVAALAIAAYLVQGMVNNLFSVPATSVVFVLIIGAFAGTRAHAAVAPPGETAPAESVAADPYTSAASDGKSHGGDR